MPAFPIDARGQSASVRRVLIGILFANLAVVAAKAAVGVRSGSLAVYGSALDSGVDALNNVLAMIVAGVAAKGPDAEHPYGHRKFETLGALAIVGFLFVTCFELVRGAVNHLTGAGHAVVVGDPGLVVLAGTLGVNAAVAWYEHARGHQLASELLIADAAHTRADVFVTVGVVIAVLFARQGWWWVDPASAIVVALLILRVSYQILARTIPVLVDERALPPDTIERTAREVAGVRGAYGIRSRGPAPVRYAEVTIAVDGSANVADAHAIADEVEARLKRDLQLHEVTVHIEPC
ncbi:MAG TPA: cation diffusion facilitator family transporter [Gemmatimonadales bacterium]